MNKVEIIGRTTTDIELRTTSSMKSVCSFSMAVDKRKKEDGADFINFVAWGNVAELLSKYVPKGTLLGVVGRLQTRSYEKNGEKRTAYEVNVEEITFIEPKKKEQQTEKEQPAEADDVDLPF